MKITGIQFFPSDSYTIQISETEFEQRKGYCANIVINDKFILQASGNAFDAEESDYSIPTAAECCWRDEESQKWFYENVDLEQLIEELESQGLENSFNWLFENADEHY